MKFIFDPLELELLIDCNHYDSLSYQIVHLNDSILKTNSMLCELILWLNFLLICIDDMNKSKNKKSDRLISSD